MWAWYFVLAILVLMAIIQLLGSRAEKPFSGLKNQLPQFREEVGEELSPEAKRKTESTVEKISGQSIPYFETVLSLTQVVPYKIAAEWSIGKNLRVELNEKFGENFWLENQGAIRIYHLNAVPQPYTQDIKIDLEKGHAEFAIFGPGETINGQLGVITGTGTFIPLAQSNDIKLPIKTN